MGESRRKQKNAVSRREGGADEAMVVDTLGRRLHVCGVSASQLKKTGLQRCMAVRVLQRENRMPPDSGPPVRGWATANETPLARHC